jgi:hypothetical protein
MQPRQPQPDARVSTLQQLIAALRADKKFIFVENSAQIDVSQIRDHRRGDRGLLTIPDGVTLAGGRSPTELGGLLYMSQAPTPVPDSRRFMLDLGANTRVTGLRLRGYDYNRQDTTNRGDTVAGVVIRGVDGVSVNNNEISGWPTAGVELINTPTGKDTAGRIRVTGNYIHNNMQCGSGYGVVIGTKGYAFIDRNVFDFNRHDVASDGQPGTGYIAELNFVLTGGPTCDGFYNQHFDVHGTAPGSEHVGGTAGEYVAIRHNTIRGNQSYGFANHLTRPAFELRGTPTDSATFTDNAVAHGDEDAAVRIKGADGDNLKNARKLVVKDNQYNVDTLNQLAVGDFDGDGRTDVFQSTGAVWVYSPSGQREWHFLNDSSLRLDRLAFGDFNGDGKTDVFSQHGDQWLVSYGGTTAWTPLPVGSNIDMKKYYRFGDFDGDRKTDIFRANGTHWYLSRGGATSWQQINDSSYKVDDLRFGDFNGDGKTDVFSFANGQWSVSYSGVTEWRRLNTKLSDDLADDLGDLIFADFNGDGRTDIAGSVAPLQGPRWMVSYGGTTPWQPLGDQRPRPLREMLLGDFTGDRRADALDHGTPYFARVTRFQLSSGGTQPFVPWSLQDML